MTTQYEPIIDIDNPAILNELEWIGTGKIYPTTLEEAYETIAVSSLKFQRIQHKFFYLMPI